MILDRFRLDGRAAIVTGAGRGIGRAIALAFAEAGADVACAARTTEQIMQTAAAVHALGRRAIAVPCDVNELAQLDELVARAQAAFGRIDLLVNNAGGWPPKPALETSERNFEAAFRFNVTSAFALTRRAVPVMLATAGHGAIVNISSRAGGLVQPGLVAYGTAKMALNYLTRELAAELAPKVRVNAIASGAVETDALEVVMKHEEIRSRMVEGTPMGRLGRVEDIAACALYLASPAAEWVTGKVIEVDGGTEQPPLRFPTPPL